MKRIFTEAKFNMSAHFEILTSNLKEHLWKIHKMNQEVSTNGSLTIGNNFV